MVATRKKFKYKPAFSSQILWSASLVLSNTSHIGLVVKSVKEIEMKLVWNLKKEERGHGWLGRARSSRLVRSKIVRGYLVSTQRSSYFHFRAISVLVRSSGNENPTFPSRQSTISNNPRWSSQNGITN